MKTLFINSKKQLEKDVAAKLKIEEDVVALADFSESELQSVFRKAVRAEYFGKKIMSIAALVLVPAIATSALTSQNTYPTLHSISTALAGISFVVGLVGARIFDSGALSAQVHCRASNNLLLEKRIQGVVPAP